MVFGNIMRHVRSRLLRVSFWAAAHTDAYMRQPHENDTAMIIGRNEEVYIYIVRAVCGWCAKDKCAFRSVFFTRGHRLMVYNVCAPKLLARNVVVILIYCDVYPCAADTMRPLCAMLS